MHISDIVLGFILQSACNVKIFIFLSDPIFHAINFGEKMFDLDKMRYFYEFLKT